MPLRPELVLKPLVRVFMPDRRRIDRWLRARFTVRCGPAKRGDRLNGPAVRPFAVRLVAFQELEPGCRVDPVLPGRDRTDSPADDTNRRPCDHSTFPLDYRPKRGSKSKYPG